MKIKITFGEILDSGCWNEFCETYGYNEWMLNEGLATATSNEEVEIDVEFAKQNNLLEMEK